METPAVGAFSDSVRVRLGTLKTFCVAHIIVHGTVFEMEGKNGSELNN